MWVLRLGKKFPVQVHTAGQLAVPEFIALFVWFWNQLPSWGSELRAKLCHPSSGLRVPISLGLRSSICKTKRLSWGDAQVHIYLQTP